MFTHKFYTKLLKIFTKISENSKDELIFNSAKIDKKLSRKFFDTFLEFGRFFIKLFNILVNFLNKFPKKLFYLIKI